MIYIKTQCGYLKVCKLERIETARESEEVSIIRITSDGSNIVSYIQPEAWNDDCMQTLIHEFEKMVSKDYSRMFFMDPQKLINAIGDSNRAEKKAVGQQSASGKIEVVSH